ncbi:MAG: ATP-binding protein [Candidatus Binatia bacterium]|nr:ATP-binding protein [Candidatus Binatia bacterium]
MDSSEIESAEETRRLRVLTIVTLMTSAMAPFFVYQYISLGIPEVSGMVVFTVVGSIGSVLWARSHADSRRGGWLVTSLLFSLLVFSNLYSGGFYDPNFGWLYVFPILAGLLVDARAGWVFALLVGLIMLLFWFAPQYGFEIADRIPPARHAEQSLANRLSAVLAIGIILSALASQRLFSRHLLEAANLELKEEIERRAYLQERLVRTERAASMGNLAAGLAHEINNPLTAVLGNLELLRMGQLTEDRAEKAVGAALEALERVVNLVQDLRLFSRGSSEELGSVAVLPAIERVSRLVAAEIRNRASFRADCTPDLFIRADASRLDQVLVNLLVNAAHSIPVGATNQNRIEIKVRDLREKVRIDISDTGCGIPPDLQRRVFEPLFTTKAVGEGTGIGLFVAQNIVHSWGGQITVTSTPGDGSTFSVLLDRADPGSEVERSAEDTTISQKAISTVPRRILIADDDVSVLDYLCNAFPFDDITTAKNGRTALERMLREEYDVVLCDLMMPELTGYDVLDEVRRRQPELEARIIFMTAGLLPGRVDETFSPTSNPLIEKPFSIQELEHLIAQLPRKSVGRGTGKQGGEG